MRRGEGPPWLSLPAEVGAALRPSLPTLVEEILTHVPSDVPIYAPLINGQFRESIRRGVVLALNRFLNLANTSQPPLTPGDREIYRTLGRQEMTSGRPMEALLSAYRSGARTTWRGVSRAAHDHDFDTEVLIALGESIFAYIDELSAASVDGYAQAQSERAGEYEHRRSELAEMIIRGEADEDAVSRACAVADWPLPELLVGVLLPPDRVTGLRTALGPGALVVVRTGEAVALVPAPRDAVARRELTRQLRGRHAVVGPSRPWQQAFDSLRLAAVAQDLRTVTRATGVDERDPVWVADNLAGVILGAEREAMQDLARARLAPLDALRESQRARLLETLSSWLRHRGQRAAMAADLNIHPQTVGYRIAQLRELFGEDLENPDVRFELELVLRAEPQARAAEDSVS